MVRDAEAHAEDDRRRREEAEVRNQADSLVYQTEKMLKDQASSFSGDQKARSRRTSPLKEALAGSDLEAIRSPPRSWRPACRSSASSSTSRLHRRPARRRAATVGLTRRRQGATDDEVVDAEIVDEGQGS